LLLLFIAVALQAQPRERVMLGEITIKGEIRQPSVSIIASRIRPEFRKLQVEKSFLTEIRQAPADVVELNSDIRAPFKLRGIDALLAKERYHQARGESNNESGNN